MDADKTKKTIALTLVTEEHTHSSPTSTTTDYNLNISLDDNLAYVNTQDTTSGPTNYQAYQQVTPPVFSNSEMHDTYTTDEISMQDDDVSTDSDNENVPQISYQEELQSRYYYYESFTHPEVHTREVDGCENPNGTIISFDDLNETTSLEMDSSDNYFNSPVTHGPTFGETPIANSTMIVDNDDSILTDVSNFVPCLWSTEVNQSFFDSSACRNSTSHQNYGLMASNYTNEESCHTPTDIHEKLTNISLCSTHDSLHVIASSSLSRDEFSMDSQDAGATSGNSTLPRTSRLPDRNYNLSFHESRRMGASNHPRVDRVPKQTFTILKALQAMKKVTKNIVKKPKNPSKQNSITGHQRTDEEAFEINIQDKRTVAKKLHRFKDSFRRKDTRQIKTLATL